MILSRTRYPFAESVQPPLPAARCQVDKLRMDYLLDGRIPSQAQIPDRSCPYVQTTDWDNSVSHHAVIDIDNLHALLPATR
jgi:hypothetical protein